MAFFERLERAFLDITRATKRCTKCGGLKDSRHRTCATCRVTSAIWTATWRRGHKANGLCWYCVQKVHVGKSPLKPLNGKNGKHKYVMCEYHIDYCNKYASAKRARLKELEHGYADAAE